MKSTFYISWAVIIGLCGIVSAATTGEALAAVSARLVVDQAVNGSWPDEPDYAGGIVAGLVDTYKLTCDADVLAAAEAGGDYIILEAGGNYYADEAFALVGLGEISDDSKYLFEAQDFYRWIKEDTTGTQDYADYYGSIDPSSAVFYMAHHVVAAYGVNAADKLIWRDMLRYYLAQVDDTNYYPVLALGAGTWALAQTDTGLDPSVPVIPQGKTGDSFWNGVSLAQLPQLIGNVQVTESPYQGGFYDRLQPGVEGYHGYTQDAAFCMLALQAAEKYSPVAASDADMPALYQALMSGVYFDSSQADSVATVYGYLWQATPLDEMYWYAGNMLMALSSSVINGDADLNDFVGPSDLLVLAGQWLSSCQTNCCLTADFDNSGKVDILDFAAISGNWQTGR
ncbi:MAG: hypothetical protein K9M75_10935 [Phycisphaerae bacterium]|nr:hypothetical protein [Phycisphaerae bacterium]